MGDRASGRLRRDEVQLADEPGEARAQQCECAVPVYLAGVVRGPHPMAEVPVHDGHTYVELFFVESHIDH